MKLVILGFLFVLLLLSACNVPPSAVNDPQLSPDAGEYSVSSLEITMFSPSGADIYYTLDGSTPTQDSNLYTGPFKISESTLVKAVCYKDSLILPSNVVSNTYVFIQ